MIYDIPVNIRVDATTEQKAELQTLDFLKEAKLEYGNNYRIADYELMEFHITENSNT